MSDYVVIADVGDSLRKLLWDSMRHDSRIYPAIIESEEEITLASRDRIALSNLRRSLGIVPLVPIPELPSDVHDLSGLARIHTAF